MNSFLYRIFLNINNDLKNDFVLQISITDKEGENVFNIKQNGDLFLTHSINHELEIYFDSKADIIFNQKFIKVFSQYNNVCYENNDRNKIIKLIFENCIKNKKSTLFDFLNGKDKINLFYTIDIYNNHYRIKNIYIEINNNEPIYIIFQNGFYYKNNDFINKCSPLIFNNFSFKFNYLNLSYEIKIPNYQYIEFFTEIINNILKFGKIT